MFKKIVLGLAGLLVVVLIAAAFRPPEFTIERSTVVNASADRIFPLVSDYHNWAQWSPFDKMDPQMKKIYEGPASGVGAMYAWEGNGNAGAGRMTTLESDPTHIRIKLEFTKPFPATNDAVFTFEPEAGGTRVTWRMSGHNNFMAKLMGLLMNMDKMVGGEFEKGLAEMKKIAESSAAAEAPKAPAQ